MAKQTFKLSPEELARVIDEVEYVCEEHFNAHPDSQKVIEHNLQKCYNDSCHEMGGGKRMVVDDWIEDMDNSIGWDWINDPIQ